MTSRMTRRVLVFALCAGALWAQPSIDEVVAAIGRTARISEIAVSPDGKRVAWIEERAGSHAKAVVLDPGKAPEVVEVGPARGLAWSADSRHLALLAFGDGGQEQVWVAAGGAAPRRLTSVKGYVARPRWSPDGTKIAFLHVEDGHGGGPLGAHPERVGVIERTAKNQRLAVADVASGAVRMVSPVDLHVHDYDWSPDGRSFAVTAEPGPGDSNWYFAKLQVVDAATGLARVVYKPKLQIAIPRWAPDGKRIALLEGLMSDEGAHGGDVMLVEAAGGAARNLTPGRGSSPSWLAWAGDSKILFTEFAGGGSVVSELDSATGAAKALYQGQERLTAGAWRPSFATSRDGSVSAMVRESLTSAPEVWMGATGAWKEATSLNKEVRPLWGKSESIEWRSGEWKVQGWLLHPAEKPKGKAPLVVLVHGGPAYLASSEWPSEWPVEAVLSARGAYVLMPNPRGSTGRGEKFKQANVKDFGGGDFRDIMAGVDSVLKREPVDGGRLGITGWSYGGYMTMWAVTQTTRFKAAAAVAGIANWQSYYGQNLIDQWMLPFFGASVYDDPAVYAKSSPITFIKRVKTPTVVMVGERDAECPAPQSFEFWHALDALGVPTRLVVYPGEGHSFAAAENRRGVLVETIEWLERYLR